MVGQFGCVILEEVSLHHRSYDLLIELRAGILEQLFPDLGKSERLSVRAVCQHRVNCVTNLDYPSPYWNLMPPQAIRVATTVDTFMMVLDGVDYLGRERRM